MSVGPRGITSPANCATGQRLTWHRSGDRARKLQGVPSIVLRLRSPEDVVDFSRFSFWPGARVTIPCARCASARDLKICSTAISHTTLPHIFVIEGGFMIATVEVIGAA